MLTTVQGTNGGVTLAGLAASTGGGLFVGLVFYAAVLACPGVAVDTALWEASLQQWILIPAGKAQAQTGSATAQRRKANTPSCRAIAGQPCWWDSKHDLSTMERLFSPAAVAGPNSWQASRLHGCRAAWPSYGSCLEMTV